MAGIIEPNGATRKRAHSLEIEARKAKIGELLVRGMSITAIAAEVKVNKSTVSRYVTDLQESTSRYLYDLCKNNLPAFYQQCILVKGLNKNNIFSFFYITLSGRFQN